MPFKVDIYKLEGGDGWSLEVVTEDGTSIVWDDLFEDDRAAFEEAISTIRSEGAVAFAHGGSNVVPFKQEVNGPELPSTHRPMPRRISYETQYFCICLVRMPDNCPTIKK